ncbi:hypothetical protein BAUCODRAFT_353055 [Baudoinia panamericana UAMH 10762]|uniref:Uncharacterized protein n=1 Tax=Baudoinia panamericana (strain UAMH 10762) TaxID=717646 RepID=M2MSK6_BAUPA|nr:uncharacterized protein BAUCODRAFT_353055 [Baudoinia panamericana UAMH 10762]EMC99861.1 hypothetical protein BAUCODRAFT_353055 [Baudoinia panamericana UAMH 10762]
MACGSEEKLCALGNRLLSTITVHVAWRPPSSSRSVEIARDTPSRPGDNGAHSTRSISTQWIGRPCRFWRMCTMTTLPTQWQGFSCRYVRAFDISIRLYGINTRIFRSKSAIEQRSSMHEPSLGVRSLPRWTILLHERRVLLAYTSRIYPTTEETHRTVRLIPVRRRHSLSLRLYTPSTSFAFAAA